jgi:hypothetical protein
MGIGSELTGTNAAMSLYWLPGEVKPIQAAPPKVKKGTGSEPPGVNAAENGSRNVPVPLSYTVRGWEWYEFSHSVTVGVISNRAEYNQRILRIHSVIETFAREYV